MDPGTHANGAAHRLLARFGSHLLGLIQYGSTVYGRPRTGSVRDFWVIVDDAAAFHRTPLMQRIHRQSGEDDIAQHIRLNHEGPNFYSLREDGVDAKIAVIGIDVFERLCASDFYVVKGRMQKPLAVVRTCPRIEAAILAARREGVREGLNLTPREFTFDRFLYSVLSLSYRAEIRPEFKGSKVRSILEAGRRQLEEIYRPLLAECDDVIPAGDRFMDTRSPQARLRARRATVRRLRRSKYSRRSFATIWKNYRTHARPLHYLYLKIRGEFEKLRHRRRRAS